MRFARGNNLITFGAKSPSEAPWSAGEVMSGLGAAGSVSWLRQRRELRQDESFFDNQRLDSDGTLHGVRSIEAQMRDSKSNKNTHY